MPVYIIKMISYLGGQKSRIVLVTNATIISLFRCCGGCCCWLLLLYLIWYKQIYLFCDSRKYAAHCLIQTWRNTRWDADSREDLFQLILMKNMRQPFVDGAIDLWSINSATNRIDRNCENRIHIVFMAYSNIHINIWFHTPWNWSYQNHWHCNVWSMSISQLKKWSILSARNWCDNQSKHNVYTLFLMDTQILSSILNMIPEYSYQ